MTTPVQHDRRRETRCRPHREGIRLQVTHRLRYPSGARLGGGGRGCYCEEGGLESVPNAMSVFTHAELENRTHILQALYLASRFSTEPTFLPHTSQAWPQICSSRDSATTLLCWYSSSVLLDPQSKQEQSRLITSRILPLRAPLQLHHSSTRRPHLAVLPYRCMGRLRAGYGIRAQLGSTDCSSRVSGRL